MPQPLGRVLSDADLEGPRGPDVRHDVTVPASWLHEGAQITLELPRLLACAACQGGGCDKCGRSGAVELRARGAEAERVELELPESEQAVLIRLPRRGGRGGEGEERGHLLLTVSPGERASDGVRQGAAPSRKERTQAEALAVLPARPAGAPLLAVLALVALTVLGYLLSR